MMQSAPSCPVCGEPLIARPSVPRGGSPNGSWAFVCDRSPRCQDRGGGTYGPGMTLEEATADCALLLSNQKKHTIEIEGADRQLLILALAKLTFTRPGWKEYARTVAETLLGAEMFDEFVTQGPDVKIDIERVVQRLDPEGEAKNPIRFTFQVNGVIALWAKKHNLAVGVAEILELCACLTLDPRAVVPMSRFEVSP